MPGDYRDYADADREWKNKKHELETALKEKRPEPEIEKTRAEVRRLKSDADWAWNDCQNIW